MWAVVFLATALGTNCWGGRRLLPIELNRQRVMRWGEECSPPPASNAAAVNPLNAQRAYGYLQQICAIGPRLSGSAGMEKQQALLEAHFEKLGGKVSYQKFLANNPLGGENVPMANMFVEWHPERKERMLLCAHYDTRPLPDRDPDPVKQTERRVHRRQRWRERRGRADGARAPDAGHRRSARRGLSTGRWRRARVYRKARSVLLRQHVVCTEVCR